MFIQEKEEIEKKEFKEVMEGDQSINDGKLEFITFQSGTTYNIESLICRQGLSWSWPSINKI